MGNSSTKERSVTPPHGSSSSSGGGGGSEQTPSTHAPGPSRRNRDHGGPSSSGGVGGHFGRLSNPLLGGGSGEGYSASRSRSRHNLEHTTLFGIGVASREGRERDREAEREAREIRKAEREKERLKERERSLKEESVDGGFLVTQGVYTGIEDFKDRIVRHLMIERRLAPFFKGIEDYEDNWTDAQLVAAVRGLPVPPAEDAPSPANPSPPPPPPSELNLTVPIASRSRAHSYTSEGSNNSPGSAPTFGFSSSSRVRSKTLSIPSPRSPTFPSTTGPVETNNPSKIVDGRPIEAVLYKSAIECPICFLYYPPFLNKTRCCDQEICSECFVQIKRADPHLPEHHGHDPSSIQISPAMADQLISEPAACPFCVETDFGVVYYPPPFRRGLVYATTSYSGMPSPSLVSGESSTASLALPHFPSSPGKRRTSLPMNSPEVVTIDKIRPDWAQKLATARSHAARRAAAATALHTAAYLMGSHVSTPGSGSGSNSGGGGFSGRRLLRLGPLHGNGAGGSESPSPGYSGTGSPRNDAAGIGGLTSLASFTERSRSPNSAAQISNATEERLTAMGLGGIGSPSGASRRESGRSRMVDLEEMMLMEAIRLSLAEEEERKKKQEAEEEEEAKKQNKDLNAGKSNASGSAVSLVSIDGGVAVVEGKGKSVDRTNSGEPGSLGGYAAGPSNYVGSTNSLQMPMSSSDCSSFRSFPKESAPSPLATAVKERLPPIDTGDGSSSGNSSFGDMFDFQSFGDLIISQERATTKATKDPSKHVKADEGCPSNEETSRAAHSSAAEAPISAHPTVETEDAAAPRAEVHTSIIDGKHIEAMTAEDYRSEQNTTTTTAYDN